jgi:hypothetical protein
MSKNLTGFVHHINASNLIKILSIFMNIDLRIEYIFE